MANEETLFTRPSLDEFPVPTYDEWKAAAIESLKGADFDKKLLTKTYEGITLKPIPMRTIPPTPNAPARATICAAPTPRAIWITHGR